MNDAAMAGDLDDQELMHLAMKAMDEDRDADAIGYLKRAISLAPEDGSLHYLLGAVHAQIGMYERAIGELQRATELAPQIDMAHFQLGLLLMTGGHVEAAQRAWAPLERLEPGHPLLHFVTGMLQLAGADYDACIASLRAGIAANTDYEALNRDMAKVIDTAEKAREAAGGAGAAPNGHAEAPAQHVLLSGYGRSGAPE